MTTRAALLMSCGLLAATPAMASMHDMLIGLDEKTTYDANGPVNAPPVMSGMITSMITFIGCRFR